jgi:hypothetical protein
MNKTPNQSTNQAASDLSVVPGSSHYVAVPYLIYGARMWSAEDQYGIIDRYYNTKEDAQTACRSLNGLDYPQENGKEQS